MRQVGVGGVRRCDDECDVGECWTLMDRRRRRRGEDGVWDGNSQCLRHLGIRRAFSIAMFRQR